MRALKDPTAGNINAANGLIDSAPTGTAGGELSSRMKADMKSSMAAAKASKAARTTTAAKSSGAGIIEEGKGFVETQENVRIALFKNMAAMRAHDKGAGNMAVKVQEAQLSLAGLGARTTTLAKRFSDLSMGLSTRLVPGFEKMLPAIAHQSFLWGKLGVDIGKQIDMQNLLQGTLGKTRDESTKTGRTLLKFAADTGMSFDQSFGAFNKNVISFLGVLESGEMTRQTLLFTARAKRMGSSVGDLTGMMDKFDTMDSAQQMGAKLNATMSAMGGGFDAVKASMMDWPERMEYMAKTVQDVMPRLKGMSAQQQRLMMKQLSEGFGTSVKTVRAMASYKPGMALPSELRMAAGGPPGAMTGKDVSEAARRAVAPTEAIAGLKEGVTSGIVVGFNKVGVNIPKALGEFSLALRNTIEGVVMPKAAELAEAAARAVMERIQRDFGTSLPGATLDAIFRGFDTYQGLMMTRVAKIEAEMTKGP